MLFLYSNIVPVKGYNRSIFYDLQREKFDLISNDLYAGLKKRNGIYRISSWHKEYLDFLIANDYVFEIDLEETGYFPPLSIEWDFPALISTAVLHIDSLSFGNLKILGQLNVKYIGLVVPHISKAVCEFLDILIHVDNMKKISVQYFNIVILNEHETDEEIYSGLNNNPFIKDILISKDNYEDFKINQNVKLLKPNLLFFSESQKHNVYFNRKLYVNEKGQISNTINFEEDYGNLSKLTFSELNRIIKSLKFNKHWYISKNSIDVCKDCEFRYMCFDSRLPLERDKNEFFNSSECNYNPYISKWKGEEGYRSLKDCGIVSNEKEFNIDYKRLKTITKEVWGNEQEI